MGKVMVGRSGLEGSVIGSTDECYILFLDLIMKEHGFAPAISLALA